MLRAALGEEPVDFDGAETVSVDELRRAALLYVKRVVLVDGGDYYRSLAVRSDASADQIDSNYRALLALFQSDDDASTGSLCDSVLRVSKAYSVVGDELRRRMYDRSRINAITGEEFDLPVDAVVDEVLANGRRPYDPINSTAETEQAWRVFPAGGQGERTWQADRPEAVASGSSESDSARPVEPPRQVSNRALIGVSLAAIGIIALVVPVLIARYSLLVPHWDRIQQAGAPASPSDGVIETLPPDSLRNEEAAALLAITEPDALTESAADFVDEPQSFGISVETPTAVAEIEPPGKAVARPSEPTAESTVAVIATPVPQSTPRLPVAAPTVAPVSSAATSPAVTTSSIEQMPALDRQPGEDKAAVDASALPIAPPAAVGPMTMAAAATDQTAQTAAQNIPPVGVFPTELLITRSDLARLVERLEAYYQDGDIFEFAGLFAVDARTNDQVDRVGIKQDYEQLFKSTAARQFSLKNMTWRYESERAVGTGEFTVRISPRWKNRDEVFSGKVELHVERAGDGLQISGMYHDYK